MPPSVFTTNSKISSGRRAAYFFAVFTDGLHLSPPKYLISGSLLWRDSPLLLPHAVRQQIFHQTKSKWWLILLSSLGISFLEQRGCNDFKFHKLTAKSTAKPQVSKKDLDCYKLSLQYPSLSPSAITTKSKSWSSIWGLVSSLVP